VNAIGSADLRAFLGSASGQRLISAGAVVPTRALEAAERRQLLEDSSIRSLYDANNGELILEHERVDFPSFPYEWAPEMLHAAGLLTLDLAQSLLPDGLGLKDATPYNVLFRGTEPVFIDVLSFEQRSPGDATWLPYAQFVRTFLLPLLANKEYGLGLDQILTTRRDGLEPQEVYRWTTLSQRLLPPFFSLVLMPTWLNGKHQEDDTSVYRKKLLSDPEKARFVLDSLFNGLRRTLKRVKPAEGKSSVWSDYMTANNNYTADHLQAKRRFVGEALAEFPSRSVLDVGCNTGEFSAIAARSGARVVAIDYDPVVVGNVWRHARTEKLDILPLVVNFTRPSPGIGWRNQECASFLDRARGKFDAVLMLAVIHHMLVTERVPLDDILALASEVTTNILVIEFIAPDDSMFQRLTRGRDELHRGLTPELFESVLRKHQFETVRMLHVEGTKRWLYLLKKRAQPK
jgi:SAM-dependent methyltransferase